MKKLILLFLLGLSLNASATMYFGNRHDTMVSEGLDIMVLVTKSGEAWHLKSYEQGVDMNDAGHKTYYVHYVSDLDSSVISGYVYDTVTKRYHIWMSQCNPKCRTLGDFWFGREDIRDN